MKTFATFAFVCFVAISSIAVAVDPGHEFGLFWPETPGEVAARENRIYEARICTPEEDAEIRADVIRFYETQQTPGKQTARETCRDHLPHQYPMQTIDCGPAVSVRSVEIEVKGQVIKLNAAEADELRQMLQQLFGYPC